MSTLVRFSGQSAGTVDATMLQPRLPGHLDPGLVITFPVGGALPACPEPLVEGAAADAEKPAEQTDRVVVSSASTNRYTSVRFTSSVSRAKKTAAYFRISFFSSNWAI